MADPQPQPEMWKSLVRARIGVTYFSADGSKRIDLIHPGMTFPISKMDRERNQATVSAKKYDPFTNGTFQLVSAPEMSEAEMAPFIDNPAVVTDEDLLDVLNIVKGSDFQERVDSIESPVFAYRLWDAAKREGVAPMRVKLVRDRIKVLEPNSVMVGDVIIVGDEVASDAGPTAPKVNVNGPSKPRQYAGTPKG